MIVEDASLDNQALNPVRERESRSVGKSRDSEEKFGRGILLPAQHGAASQTWTVIEGRQRLQRSLRVNVLDF